MKAVTPETRFQTWCIYGTSGGGKTTLAGTAPKPIIMDSNQGLTSIAGRPGFEHVRSEDIHTFRDLERAYTYCTGTSKKKDWSKLFDTIVFDHFDDVQAIVLNELGEKAAKKDPDRRDADMIEQREWGIMASRLKRYLRKFKRVPMHKILICGEAENKDNGILRPNLTGQLKDQLPYFCDHVAYIRVRKGRRFLYLDPTSDFFAKTRAWWLPPEARKIELPFDDTTALTKLFALVAAGPKGAVKRSVTSTSRSK